MRGLIFDGVTPIRFESRMHQSAIAHAISVTLGRTIFDTHIFYIDEYRVSQIDPLGGIPSLLLRQEMCDHNERGRCYCTNFHEVLKPRLALIIPQGIRAPPGSLYLPEDNAPTGAFCIYSGHIMSKSQTQQRTHSMPFN